MDGVVIGPQLFGSGASIDMDGYGSAHGPLGHQRRLGKPPHRRPLRRTQVGIQAAEIKGEARSRLGQAEFKASILNVESMVFPIFANCDSSLIREDFPCQQHYHQRFERVSNNTSKRA